MISYQEALEKISALKPLQEIELTPLENCYGRILGRDIHTLIPSPAFTNSAMDGIAYRHDAVSGSDVTLAGTIFAAALNQDISDPGPNCAVKIMTGAPLPTWADTVVPVEACSQVSDHKVHITQRPERGSNVRSVGEDLPEGVTLLKQGTFLDPERLMIAANFGYDALPTLIQPKVCIISTGDELRQPGTPLEPGAIYNSTRVFLETALKACGLTHNISIQIPDQAELLAKEVQSFIENNEGPKIILSTGAVSAGEKDFIPVTARTLGFQEIFHKVAVRPGKPLYLAKKSNDIIWIGIPGNPISTATTWHFFIQPLLTQWTGAKKSFQETVQLKDAVKKPTNLRCFYRCTIKDGIAAVPVKQGSSHLKASIEANAYVQLPEGTDFVPAGEKLIATRIGFYENR